VERQRDWKMEKNKAVYLGGSYVWICGCDYMVSVI